MHSTLSVIVPCYNEEASLPHLWQKLQTLSQSLSGAWELDVVFVNDGSSDATAAILAELQSGDERVRIVAHEVNRGLGAALASGFAAARGDFVAALDCDCTYDPLTLVDMLDALDDETDVLTGSEFHPEGRVVGVPRLRLLFSRTMCLMYRWLFWTRIHSFSCLLRVYRREVVEALPIRSRGFLSCTEILMRALSAGYRVREFPVTLTAREHGESKIPIVRTIFDHLWFMARLRLALWFQPQRRAVSTQGPIAARQSPVGVNVES
jgi:dolichol-phosphate mannosyltransferase